MASVSRAKDIITRNVQDFLQTTASDYSKYLSGAQSYITYFQPIGVASTTDQTLETVHSLIGGNSPKKYKQINDVVVYGVSEMMIDTQLSDRGLESEISGEFVFLPNTIRPRNGDFFYFDYDGLRDHLFQVTDVQYDRATPEKYYKVTFSIYKYNSAEILENVEGTYVMDFDNIGGEESAVIEEAAKAENNAIEEAIEKATETYKSIFYDDDTDSFLCNINGKYAWSPYLQHFIFKTGIFKNSEKEFMTEIYIQDINEVDFPKYYKEIDYRKSLFSKIETGENVTIDNDFIAIKPVDLKGTRNLPFFQNQNEFVEVGPVQFIVNEDGRNAFSDGFFNYMGSFPIFEGSWKDNFDNVDHFHKFHILDEIHNEGRKVQFKDKGEKYPLKDGDLVYECRNNEIEVTGLYRVSQTINELGESVESFDDVSLNAKIAGIIETPNFFQNILIEYLAGTLEITDDLLDSLRKEYFKPSLENFILIPIVIYILRKQIK